MLRSRKLRVLRADRFEIFGTMMHARKRLAILQLDNERRAIPKVNQQLNKIECSAAQ